MSAALQIVIVWRHSCAKQLNLLWLHVVHIQNRIGLEKQYSVKQPKYSDVVVVYHKTRETRFYVHIHSVFSSWWMKLCLNSRLESIYSKPRSKAWNPWCESDLWMSSRRGRRSLKQPQRTERSCLLLQSELSQMPYGGVCLSCAVFCGVVFFGQFGVGWVWKHCIVEDMWRTGHKSCAEPSRTNDWRLQLGPRLRGSN